jgi:hypothetical protein
LHKASNVKEKAPDGNTHGFVRRITALCRIDILSNEGQREKDIA